MRCGACVWGNQALWETCVDSLAAVLGRVRVCRFCPTKKSVRCTTWRVRKAWRIWKRAATARPAPLVRPPSTPFSSPFPPCPTALTAVRHPPADMFFGGGGGGRRKGPNAHVSTDVTLEDLYNGGERSARIKRNIICKKCKGTGAKGGQTKKCKQCGGRGVRLRLRLRLRLRFAQFLVSPVCSATFQLC